MEIKQIYHNIGKDVLDASFNVMRNAGRFMRERYYEAALAFELTERGHEVKRQVAIPAVYRGVEIEDSYHADIIVDDMVIIEIKALPFMKQDECRQLLSYLKLGGFHLGYLINFGAKDFTYGRFSDSIPYTKGIYRFVNNI